MVLQHPHFYNVKIALEVITDSLSQPNLYESILTILLNLNLNFSSFYSQENRGRKGADQGVDLVQQLQRILLFLHQRSYHPRPPC